MGKIQMVDLKGQYNKIKEEVDRAVLDVIASSAYINGPEVQHFQQELEQYLDVKHVIPCANGTDALQVALMALNLKPGDEVITSDFTFAATVEVVALLGLKPVLVDVEPDTYNLDPEAVKKAITPKTKAIVPVHLFGQSANMEALLQIAEENDIKIVEDNAQAIGAMYQFSDGRSKRAGTIGDIGTTSFFPSKNLGAYGDGGAIFTDNDEYAAKLRSLVNHGMGERYYYEDIGVNSRLDSMQAAVLRVKLRHLDEYIDARNRAAQAYDTAFGQTEELVVPFRASYSNHVFHQYTLRVTGANRDDLKNYLQAEGIPAMIYYPVPLHRQNAYRQPEFKDEDFKVTNELCKEVISLPMHTELSDEQLHQITETITQYLQQ